MASVTSGASGAPPAPQTSPRSGKSAQDSTTAGDATPTGEAAKAPKKPPTEEEVVQRIEPGCVFSAVQACQRGSALAVGVRSLTRLRRFFTEKFNPIAALVERLPASVDLSWLEQEEDARRTEEEAVNVRLSQRIMGNYDAFVKAMVDIRVLASELQLTARCAQNARLSLATAEANVARPALLLLARAERRQRLRAVLTLLEKVRRLSEWERATEAATAAGDYAAAIQLCLNCQTLVAELKDLQCVAPFYTTLQTRYQGLHSRLDAALAEQTRAFSPPDYARILDAFRLLGRTDGLLERLQKHFREQIVAAVRDTLLRHAPPLQDEPAPDGSKRCDPLALTHAPPPPPC